MIVHLEFVSYFAQYLDEKIQAVDLPQSEATLEAVLEAFFKQFPSSDSVFKQHFNREGKVFALFVCCGDILRPESILKDGDRIKVVSPISGG
jgi:molybdopterin converting factor small subunit